MSASLAHIMDSTALPALLEFLQAQSYDFRTPTPLSHARVNARAGTATARSVADIFGWSRPFQPDILPARLFENLRAEDALVADTTSGFWRSKYRVSSLGGMLFLHSAHPTASPDSVFFGPDTYKFADTIKHHLHRRAGPVMRAVDICAGAGPGALTIAHAFPDANVLMADINDAALALSGLNACHNGFPRARPVHSDLLSATTGDFDLVVAHPPYLIDRGTRIYRHGGGSLGASLALAIVGAALPRLSPGGTLLLFTGVAIVNTLDPFRAEVASMIPEGFDWTYREVDPDVFGEELEHEPYTIADRIALVVLEVTNPKEAAVF